MTASAGPPRDVLAARRSIGAMFFLIGALNASWVSRIPAMKGRLELGDRDLGLLLLCPAVGAMLAFRFAGGLAARHGSRRTAWASTALLCVLLVFPAFAPTPLATALSLGAFGATSGMMDVSINAHGLEVEAAIGRPILGSLHGIVSFGRLIGAGAGALAAWAHLPPTVHLPIVAVAFEAMTSFFGPGLLRRGSPPAASSSKGGARARGVFALGPSTWILLALGAVCFCSSASEGAVADWSGVYLRDVLRTSEATAAVAYAAFSLAMLGGRFAGDRLTLMLGPIGIVRWGGLLVASALAIGLAIHTTPAMMAAFMCVGLGVSVLVPTAFRAGARVPGVEPAAAIATLATVSYAAFFAGPPVIGFVSERATLRAGLLVVAGLGLLLAAFAPAVEGRAPSLRAVRAWLQSKAPRPRPR